MLLGEANALDSQPGWVQDLSSRLQAGGSMPLVAGIVWFNQGGYAYGSNPNTKTAVKTMLQSPAFSTPAPTPAPATRLVCPAVANPVVGQTVSCTYQ
jgi:hypothetical protein